MKKKRGERRTLAVGVAGKKSKPKGYKKKPKKKKK